MPAPYLVSFIGCPVSLNSMEQYSENHKLPISSDRRLLQHLESRINIPLALVCVERDNSDGQYYLCCFADYSGRPYDKEELSAITIPQEFEQLRNANYLDLGDLERLVEPKAEFASYDQSGKMRSMRSGNGQIGAENV